MALDPISPNLLMPKVVREPIQVYLTPTEREELDRAAGALGVSRSEVLRRGIRTIGMPGFVGSLRDLADDGYVTAPMRGPGALVSRLSRGR